MMMTSRKNNAGITGADRGTVVGLFRTQVDAERAIRDLKQTGIAENRMGVAMMDRAGAGRREPGEDSVGTTSPAGAGATAGALSGGILGGAVGLLAGVGALAIPGVGPIIAGGALASALVGAGVGAAAGGLMGALVGMGIPEEDARYFEQGFRAGGVLVTVDAGSRGPEAREILRASGADLGGTGPARAWDAEEEDLTGADVVGREAWRGSERRYHDDSAYAGPERRFSAR
jgi:hypothetical protein